MIVNLPPNATLTLKADRFATKFFVGELIYHLTCLLYILQSLIDFVIDGLIWF